MIQDILAGYLTGCVNHPLRISCKDISFRVS